MEKGKPKISFLLSAEDMAMCVKTWPIEEDSTSQMVLQNNSLFDNLFTANIKKLRNEQFRKGHLKIEKKRSRVSYFVKCFFCNICRTNFQFNVARELYLEGQPIEWVLLNTTECTCFAVQDEVTELNRKILKLEAKAFDKDSSLEQLQRRLDQRESALSQRFTEEIQRLREENLDLKQKLDREVKHREAIYQHLSEAKSLSDEHRGRVNDTDLTN